MKNTGQSILIRKELFKQLLQQSKSTLILGQSVATIVFLGLLGQVDFMSLILWYTVISITTVVRLYLNHVLGNKITTSDSSNKLSQYIFSYSMGALIAGATWASLILFNKPELPSIVQTFILVITIGIPMAALSTNAILPCVFYAFTLPLLTAILVWPLVLTDQIEIKFLLTAIIYSILVIVTGRRFRYNLRSSIENSMEKQRLVEELRELAFIDHLTELPNRRQFQIMAERTLARVKRHQASMALMLIDVDNFKFVNDTYGHEAGDELLIELSKRIKHSIRLNDMAARLGGDEFIVMLECEHNHIEVEPAVNRILQNLTPPMKLSNIDYLPSVSIGIAVMPNHASDMRTLMSCADQAMYCAKQSGGNSFSIYESSDTDASGDFPAVSKQAAHASSVLP